MNRRTFLTVTVSGSAGAFFSPPLLANSPECEWDPDRPFRRLGDPLRILPVLMVVLPTARPQTSWRSWGGLHTPADVDREIDRIHRELRLLKSQADFPLEFLPMAQAASVEQAAAGAHPAADAVLVYANTGSATLLRACLALAPHAVLFVRHRSGPVSYWYEALSTRLLGSNRPPAAPNPGTEPRPAHVDDVVVDDPAEVLWRFRALFGVKNTRKSRILALGGAWGKYAPDAPAKAVERFGFQIIDVGYDAFAPRLSRARADTALAAAAERATRRYLRLPRTRLATDRQFLVNAFILHRVIRDLMAEHDTSVFTIKSCMGTIIPMSETTACLPLEILNDEGLIAFCESDFVILPAGLLVRHIAGKPVFLHNSTFPHAGQVTCAHCTCPRRLDGRRYAPAQIVTHFESDYGAAPKVDMPLGQRVSFVDPEFSTPRWLGFAGRVRANPSYDICRSQQDVEILGNWRRLIPEVRDSHWIMVYGDVLREIGYAARKFGLDWDAIPAPA